MHGDDRPVAAEARVAAAVVDVSDADDAQRLGTHDARLTCHKEVAATQPLQRAAPHTLVDCLELSVARRLCPYEKTDHTMRSDCTCCSSGGGGFTLCKRSSCAWWRCGKSRALTPSCRAPQTRSQPGPRRYPARSGPLQTPGAITSSFVRTLSGAAVAAVAVVAVVVSVIAIGKER